MGTTKTLSRKEKTISLIKKYKALSIEQIEALSKFVIVSIENNRAYSGRNQQLIAMQLNNPTICGGFHQWRIRSRKVKKGEHGALILYPVGTKKDSEDDEEPTNFFSAVVFDISQTEELKEDE
jgi:hypothetical protein